MMMTKTDTSNTIPAQSKTVLESLNLGLHQALAANPLVMLLGEDILDPYGGAFKVTRGLSSTYPNQILTTPISEAGIIGMAGGMALRGLRPVVEIMFGDFLALGADQIINHLSKFKDMYNGQVNVPVLIRTPMGGRRGYGPTHSQTLEKHFLGVSGLRVLAPFHAANGNIGAPGELLTDTIMNSNQPVLFIENKLQYLLHLFKPGTSAQQTCEQIPTSTAQSAPYYRVTVSNAPRAQVTLAVYGYMAHLAMQAQLRLAYELELFTEIIIPTQLSPFELSPILESARQTGNLLTIDEGTPGAGWGAEVLAQAAEALGLGLIACRRITAKGSQVPAGRALEEGVLPQVSDIISTIQDMTRGS